MKVPYIFSGRLILVLAFIGSMLAIQSALGQGANTPNNAGAGAAATDESVEDEYLDIDVVDISDPNRPNLVTEQQFVDGKTRKPKMTDEGYARKTIKYDEAGMCTEEAYWDLKGKPANTSYGYAKVLRIFNSDRLCTSESFYDTNGELTVPKDPGYARAEHKFDSHGECVESAYFGKGGIPMIGDLGSARVVSTKDLKAGAIIVEFYGVNGKHENCYDGYAKSVTKYDESDYVLEVSYFGSDGKPIEGISRYARAKFTRNQDGVVIEDWYFDANGQPTLVEADYEDKYNEDFDPKEEASKPRKPIKDGYHHSKRMVNVDGLPTEILYMGVNDKPTVVRYGYAKFIKVYGPDGDVLSERYFDADDKPVDESKIKRRGYESDGEDW